jgi:L-fuconolactonase
VIDAHHHLWRYDPVELDWMTPDMGVLARDFAVEELEGLAREVGVVGTVAVQARRTVRETERLLAIAAAHPLILGVVGWADAEDPGLEATVERFARHPRFVGLREVLHDMPGADYATGAAHRRLVAAAEAVDAAYDLLVRPEHLPAATELVDAFPAVRFVVDHIGKPPRDASAGEPVAERRQRWRAGMRALAERPNVACKLSGLLTEGDWRRWRPDEVTPFLDEVVEAFGPSRCMVGSDWPVCTLAAPYGENLGLVARYAAALSTTDRHALLEGTARTWYRLDQGKDGVG